MKLFGKFYMKILTQSVSKLVPKDITANQKKDQVAICADSLKAIEMDPTFFGKANM